MEFSTWLKISEGIVNKFIFTVFAGAALFGTAGMAAAQDTGMQSVQVSASYIPAPREFDYGPEYKLQTGDVLKVRQEGNRYFSQLGDAPEIEILPQARGVFLARTGAKIEFRDSGQSVVVTDPDRLGLAVAAPRGRRLAGNGGSVIRR